ncbi:fumarylacetoacetate hydrolase family protein [Jannaschia sp. W003]|uniref:fumarylacetoacetate hydrolase family protein n=1 Tax=Jannaschia sp. W003 TaxID=2867012 RepID=UPI0021A52C5E|nr:fumarylacetoacetate hydrolase family protein [Jannaschia sp. W003]UWQ21865.1 fumarylacetoacetate hydrolase family protein [Jannaschia sp. W003]
MSLAFPLPPIPTLKVEEGGEYAVRRIFCVGRNYAEHTREMGHEPTPEAPFYFTKSPAHMVRADADIPFPPETADYHHEVELAVALGADVFRASEEEAAAAAWAYAVALDMTRRDRQQEGKDRRRPWDLGKDVEASAVVGTLRRDFEPADQRIEMRLNGELRQDGRLSDMIHGVPAIVADLSRFYHLGPGDLILTGTPAGVGKVEAGDAIMARVEGLPPFDLRIGPPL